MTRERARGRQYLEEIREGERSERAAERRGDDVVDEGALDIDGDLVVPAEGTGGHSLHCHAPIRPTAATRQGALPDGTSGEPHARSTKRQLAMDGARAWGVGFKSHEVVDMDGC